MGTVHVLGNPAARGGSGDAHEVVDAARSAGHDVVLLEPDSSAGASAAAVDAVRGGTDRLIAVGGDGLARIAVGAVAETDVVLGIVAQGTGNDFARSLGLLGGGLPAAIRRSLAEPTGVDAMRTNHGWVASVATMGFSGDVTARANALRWPAGQHRYTAATVLELPRLRRRRVTVTIDGASHETDTTLLAVGNTAYFGGGMRVCPDARPDDGRLHTVVIGAVGRGTFLRVFPRVFGGTHVSHPAVTTHRSTSVVVEGEDAEMWADGDPLGLLPVTCELVPRALRVAGATTH